VIAASFLLVWHKIVEVLMISRFVGLGIYNSLEILMRIVRKLVGDANFLLLWLKICRDIHDLQIH
jgi:hypothetical protein